VSSARFDQAVARIDEENAKDPNLEEAGGETVAKELLYGRRMSETLARLLPEASEALRLACRAQHIRRWEVPRASYPEGRAGYHRWRTDLAKRHADHAARILGEVGYDELVIARVRALVRKKGLATDVEAQALEDVACVVFLEHYFAPFAAKHDDDAVVRILEKTWAKMSERGREVARSLPLGERERELVERALGAGSPTPG
jgi:hypothetical protein